MLTDDNSLVSSPVSALPNTRLFVSHCGMNGVMESVFHKVTRDFVLSKIIIFSARQVPLVCLPIFADQPDNAARVQERGLGVVLDR